MILGRCCRCGSQSSSSSSASASASTSASSQSESDASASAGSVSDSGTDRECLVCNGQIAPGTLEFSWALANNCPADPGNPTVGCYDHSVGPFDCGNNTANPNADFSTHGRLLPESVCLWSNSSTGEVEGGNDPHYCGTCSQGPAISIAVGIDEVGNYFIWVVVSFFWSCTPEGGGGPPPPVQEGSLSMLYEKYSVLPFNCLALNELDLTNATGNYDFPIPGGGFTSGGWGPGCNLAFGQEPFGTGFAESTFPLTINVQPAS